MPGSAHDFNILSFNNVMDFPLGQLCTLCFEVINKSSDKYRVEGKGQFVVLTELKCLPFAVTIETPCVCRECYQKLKKRRSLLSQIDNIEKALKCKYNDNKSKQTSTLKRPSSEQNAGCASPTKFIVRSGNDPDTILPCSSSPVRSSSSRLPEPFCSPIRVQRRYAHFARAQEPQVIERREKKNVDVTVKVEWPSKDQERKLPEDLESLGKMLVRGTYKQIVCAAWKNISARIAITELIAKEIEKETTLLCSKKNPSILRMTDKTSMTSFSMDNVATEIKNRAPMFHSVLLAASVNSKSKSSSTTPSTGAIAMAAAICLKNRSRYMIAAQLMVTIFIYHANFMVSHNLIYNC